jgi:C_GCAxxG_C_C family probable redox protein
MISRGEVRFNCCESTLMRIDEAHRLPGFGVNVMRITSNFGGGVAGWGDVCGAVSGAAMALGLVYGTSGDEAEKEFSEKRKRMRTLTHELMKAFEEDWGHINCHDLLGCNRRAPEGKAKYDEMKAKGLLHCDEYVQWAERKALELMNIKQ